MCSVNDTNDNYDEVCDKGTVIHFSDSEVKFLYLIDLSYFKA